MFPKYSSKYSKYAKMQKSAEKLDYWWLITTKLKFHRTLPLTSHTTSPLNPPCQEPILTYRCCCPSFRILTTTRRIFSVERFAIFTSNNKKNRKKILQNCNPPKTFFARWKLRRNGDFLSSSKQGSKKKHIESSLPPNALFIPREESFCWNQSAPGWMQPGTVRWLVGVPLQWACFKV